MFRPGLSVAQRGNTPYLSLMVDLDLDFDLARDGPEPSELALLVVVVTGVELGVLVGQLDRGDQEMVL